MRQIDDVKALALSTTVTSESKVARRDPQSTLAANFTENSQTGFNILSANAFTLLNPLHHQHRHQMQPVSAEYGCHPT